MRCYWCEVDRPHPFHDDGTQTEVVGLWYKGGPYSAPRQYEDEDEPTQDT